MRLYYSIWHRIKTRGTATVEHHPQLFARLKKAVIKEKDQDTGFKLQLEEQGKRARLAVEIVKTKEGKQALKFTLKYSLTADDL